MATTTFNPEKDIPDLAGKVIFITGGNQGLGKESILHLIKHNPSHVYFTARTPEKATSAISEFNTLAPNIPITPIQCDLTSLASVKSAASTFLQHSSRLDVLLCNAGIMMVPQATTTDGYEIQFGTNHMGHALLIKLLLPTLQQTASTTKDARIIIVSSQGYKAASKIYYKTLKNKGDGLPFPFLVDQQLYCQSKLANVIYAAELARRYPEVLSVSLHPAVATTNLVNRLSWFERGWVRITTAMFGQSVLTPEEGAHNQVYLATVEKDKLENGAFYMPVGKVERRTKAGEDKEFWKELWEWTEKELEPWSL